MPVVYPSLSPCGHCVKPNRGVSFIVKSKWFPYACAVVALFLCSMLQARGPVWSVCQEKWWIASRRKTWYYQICTFQVRSSKIFILPFCIIVKNLYHCIELPVWCIPLCFFLRLPVFIKQVQEFFEVFEFQLMLMGPAQKQEIASYILPEVRREIYTYVVPVGALR